MKPNRWMFLGISFAWAAIANSAAAGPTDAEKCRADKFKQAGKYSFCRMKAESKAVKKAESPDYSKCDTKIADKFGNAEAKWGSECPTTGDVGAIQAQVTQDTDDLVVSLSGGGGASTADAIKCEADKLKRAGQYAFCRMKAEAKAAKKGEAPDHSKCDTKIGDKFGKADAKWGSECPTTGDVGAIQAQVAQDTDDLVLSLSAAAASFTADVYPIFESTGCSEAICHGVAANGSLDLSTPALAYSSLVGVLSMAGDSGCIGVKPRVYDPLDPDPTFGTRADNSYLVDVLIGAAASPSDFPSCTTIPRQMPLDPIPKLTAGEIATIRAWINGGAAND